MTGSKQSTVVRVQRRCCAAFTILLCSLLLTGCFGITPYGVAQHEQKRDYHLEGGSALIESDIMGGLNGLQEFTAVGYMHGVAGSAKLHVQKESTVIGGTVVSRESSDDATLTIDTVHIEGSGLTYSLFGDAYLSVTRTPWVAMPGEDVRREGTALCDDVSAVWYVCKIMQAWLMAQEDHPQALPFRLETGGDGSRHYITALTPVSLEKSGLFTFDEDLRARLGEQTLQAPIPLHIWLDKDGVVTKIETSASLPTDQEPLEMQFGFERTGVPGDDDVPTDPATLDPSAITTITDPEKARQLWDQVAEIRQQ